MCALLQKQFLPTFHLSILLPNDIIFINSILTPIVVFLFFFSFYSTSTTSKLENFWNHPTRAVENSKDWKNLCVFVVIASLSEAAFKSKESFRIPGPYILTFSHASYIQSLRERKFTQPLARHSASDACRLVALVCPTRHILLRFLSSDNMRHAVLRRNGRLSHGSSCLRLSSFFFFSRPIAHFAWACLSFSNSTCVVLSDYGMTKYIYMYTCVYYICIEL